MKREKLKLWAAVLLVAAALTASFAGIRRAQAASGDFTMTASPIAQAVSPLGAPADYTLVLAAGGEFDGTVQLGCTTISPHISCAVSPASVALSGNLAARAEVTAAADGSTPPGTYSITIVGVSGSLSQSQVVYLIVN